MYSTLIKRSLMIKAIASLLSKICKENTKAIDTNNQAILPFLSKEPHISIKSYLTFLVNETQIESSVLITMLILIDRLCEKNHFCLNYFNIYRIILSTLILATKVSLDDSPRNNLYTKVKGIARKEVFQLEYICFTLLEFSLYINEREFFNYYDHLTKVIKVSA